MIELLSPSLLTTMSQVNVSMLPTFIQTQDCSYYVPTIGEERMFLGKLRQLEQGLGRMATYQEIRRLPLRFFDRTSRVMELCGGMEPGFQVPPKDKDKPHGPDPEPKKERDDPDRRGGPDSWEKTEERREI